ncbi:hypothetical protein CSIRO_0940 [Bradyrhizobiaceae bacterium SG-6C]|nr:hypothetical protein CSIRO_0940 [Bradyrhizobiaceae bacterium SG-6C]
MKVAAGGRHGDSNPFPLNPAAVKSCESLWASSPQSGGEQTPLG